MRSLNKLTRNHNLTQYVEIQIMFIHANYKILQDKSVYVWEPGIESEI